MAVILKQIRTTLIPIPATISPLPKTPPPVPLVQVKEEPKCRFPILPRCAFNWTAKKLPISDRLTEQFGAYLHPGVQVRVRFRRVGTRRLRDLRSPDTLSHSSQSVANFAEAERRPKPFVNPFLPVEDAEELGKKSSPKSPSVPAQESSNLLEKTPSLTAPPSLPQIPEAVKSPLVNVPLNKAVQKAAPTKRPKVDGLFGSDSSDTSESEPECEPEVCPPSVQDQSKQSKLKGLTKGQQLEVVNESRATPTLANNPRTKLLPLGKGSRLDSPPVKPVELRRETESPSLTRLGLGRVAKSPGNFIAPCSEALLSAVTKAKTFSRVATPLRRPVKEPEVPRTPVVVDSMNTSNSVATLILSDSSQDDSPFRKRVSHATKRALESDVAITDLVSPSKRGKTKAGPSPSPRTPISPVPAKIHTENISVKTKSKHALPVNPQEFIKLGTKVTPSSVKQKLGQAVETSGTSPEVVERAKETIAEDVGANEMEQEISMEQSGMDETSSSEEENPSLSMNESSYIEENKPPQLPENPQSPDVEERLQLPDIEDGPQSPDMDESPQSPDDQFGHSSTNEAVKTVPTSPASSKLEQPSAFDLISQQLLKQKNPQAVGAGSKSNIST